MDASTHQEISFCSHLLGKKKHLEIEDGLQKQLLWKAGVSLYRGIIDQEFCIHEKKQNSELMCPCHCRSEPPHFFVCFPVKNTASIKRVSLGFYTIHHQKFQEPKMEGFLYLIFGCFGGFPLSIHTAETWVRIPLF